MERDLATAFREVKAWDPGNFDLEALQDRVQKGHRRRMLILVSCLIGLGAASPLLTDMLTALPAKSPDTATTDVATTPPANSSTYHAGAIQVKHPYQGSTIWAQVTMDISWESGDFPGVHECEVRLHGADGRIVGSQTEILVFRERVSTYQAEVSVNSKPKSAAFSCQAERLDAPGGDFAPDPVPADN